MHTQESLADGALLKGTLGCEECAGSLLVRVLPPPPSADAAEEDEGIVLITQKSFEAPGPFEIRVPKDRSAVVLQVVEDADESGKPSAGERMGIVIDGPIAVADVVEGIELTVGVFPQMGNAPAAEGLPPGTEPPGGGPGGTPPAAGPTEDGEENLVLETQMIQALVIPVIRQPVETMRKSPKQQPHLEFLVGVRFTRRRESCRADIP